MSKKGISADRMSISKNRKDKNAVTTTDDIKAIISSEVKKYNAFFGDTEQIKKFEIVNDKWSIENGILTPTLKVKRKVVEQRYKDLIDSMFE